MTTARRIIIYGMVVCAGTPVADCSPHSGTLKKYCEELIGFFLEEKEQNPRITYRLTEHDEFLFHVLRCDDMLTLFICVTQLKNEAKSSNAADETKFAFMCLNDLYQAFYHDFESELQIFKERNTTPLPYEMKKKFPGDYI